MTFVGTRRLGNAVACVLILLSAEGWAESSKSKAPAPVKLSAGPSSATNLREDINPNLRNALERQMNEQKKARVDRLNNSGAVGIFQDKDGVPMITNRVGKYRSRSDFAEIKLSFEPIQVQPTYRRLKAQDKYNAESIAHLVDEYAQKWSLDRDLVLAVIKAESNFRQDAVSRAGACGLMQLMPGTASDMGVTDIYDPAENIAGGTQYLAKMLALFDNNVQLALAGYNAGPQTVINCGRQIPNIRETQDYVKRVIEYWAMFKEKEIAPDYLPAPKKPRIQLAAAQRADKANTAVKEVKMAAKDDPPPAKVIHFVSGLTQPADSIIDDHPTYYYVKYRGRMFSVPKKFVKEIV